MIGLRLLNFGSDVRKMRRLGLCVTHGKPIHQKN